jgi:hypothetical protein
VDSVLRSIYTPWHDNQRPSWPPVISSDQPAWPEKVSGIEALRDELHVGLDLFGNVDLPRAVPERDARGGPPEQEPETLPVASGTQCQRRFLR